MDTVGKSFLVSNSPKNACEASMRRYKSAVVIVQQGHRLLIRRYTLSGRRHTCAKAIP